MTNPWINIPYEDYEAHMSHTDVGQLKVLGEITRQALETYLPDTFALLGACTGNGLEYVNQEVTREVYCVDINARYLQVIDQRFGKTLPGLHLICADLDRQVPDIRQADLVMAALLLEYVNPQHLMPVIEKMMAPGAVVVLVIQQSSPGHFVSPTSYSSLQPLGAFSHELNEQDLVNLSGAQGLNLIGRRELVPAKGKKFTILEFRKERTSNKT